MGMIFLILFPGLPLAALAGLAGYGVSYCCARFLRGRIGFVLATLSWSAPAAFLIVWWSSHLMNAQRGMEELGLMVTTVLVVGWSLGALLGGATGRDADGQSRTRSG